MAHGIVHRSSSCQRSRLSEVIYAIHIALAAGLMKVLGAPINPTKPLVGSWFGLTMVVVACKAVWLAIGCESGGVAGLLALWAPEQSK